MLRLLLRLLLRLGGFRFKSQGVMTGGEWKQPHDDRDQHSSSQPHLGGDEGAEGRRWELLRLSPLHPTSLLDEHPRLAISLGLLVLVC